MLFFDFGWWGGDFFFMCFKRVGSKHNLFVAERHGSWVINLELRKGCLFSTVYLWAGPFHGLQGGTLGVQKSEAKCAKLVDLGKCYQYRSPFVFSISLFDRYHMPRRYRGRPARSHLSSPIRRALRLRNDAQRPGHRDPPRAWRLCLRIELN